MYVFQLNLLWQRSTNIVLSSAYGEPKSGRSDRLLLQAHRRPIRLSGTKARDVLSSDNFTICDAGNRSFRPTCLGNDRYGGRDRPSTWHMAGIPARRTGYPTGGGLKGRTVNCDAVIRGFLRVHRENFRATGRNDRRCRPLGCLDAEDGCRSCWLQGISLGSGRAPWHNYRHRGSRPHSVSAHHDHQHIRRK